MVSRKNVSKPKTKAVAVKKRVWRVTPECPQGEWVDSDSPISRPAPLDPAHRPDSGWHTSSYDLSSGLEVSDSPDTVPADLIDKLFKKPDPGGT